jgi:hypothetical protein
MANCKNDTGQPRPKALRPKSPLSSFPQRDRYTLKDSASGLTYQVRFKSYPLAHTPSNQAWDRNNAWAAYNANLRHIPTAQNPNRLAAGENLLLLVAWLVVAIMEHAALSLYVWHLPLFFLALVVRPSFKPSKRRDCGGFTG